MSAGCTDLYFRCTVGSRPGGHREVVLQAGHRVLKYTCPRCAAGRPADALPACCTGPVCVVLWRRRAACCASLAFWPTRSAARHGTRAYPRPLRPTCPRCATGRPADTLPARWTGPSLVPHFFPTPSWATWPASLENAVLPGRRRKAVTGTLLAHSWARLVFFPGGSTTRIANAPKV